MYGYVICEYERVKDYFPEFKSIMETLRTTLIAKCQADWAPKTFGGMTPKAGQFGESTIMPELFRDLTNTTLTSWYQWFANTSSGATAVQRIIMSGANTGNIYEDYQIGLAGIAFLSKATRISEIKMQIGDKKIPRMNIEEAFAYNKPAIVFEQPFILDEETSFDLYANITTLGPQRIKLIGVQMNRNPNKLQTTVCGAALT